MPGTGSPSGDKPRILVFGSQGHAKTVLDVVEAEGRYRVAGCIDVPERVGAHVLGYEVLGSEERLPQLMDAESIHGGIVAIGQNHIRARVVQRILSLCPAFRFVSIRHPLASVSRHAAVGAGCVLLPGVSIGPDTRIGDHVIMYSNSCIEHDSIVYDFACFAPGVAAGGHVHIGQLTHLGVGANVLHGMHIGGHCVIGAGAVVCTDIPACSIAYGVPCRVVRSRERDDAYL